MRMKYIGAHVDGYPAVELAPAEASALGATAFALNLTDQARFTSPAISEESAEEFRARCAGLGFTAAQILPHAGFVINLCSPDARKLTLSRMALAEEMRRAAALGLTMVNFHPGATLGKLGEDEATALVAESINKVLEKTRGVTAVIENTAGQGSNIGYSWQQLAAIIDGVEDKSRVGVCIDTAHAFAAGYDLATAGGYEKTWAEFDVTIGLQYLRGMHLNDSQRPCGSRIDRHAPIGKGTIGADCFARLMRDGRTDGIPLILETPDPALWQQETSWLLSQAQTQ